jgi:hypothetical protein
MIDMIVVQSPPRLACVQKGRVRQTLKALAKSDRYKAPAEISEISAHAQEFVISNNSLRHALGPSSAPCPPQLTWPKVCHSESSFGKKNEKRKEKKTAKNGSDELDRIY